MYTYNTTYLVEESRYAEWLAFIKPALTTALVDELGFDSLNIMRIISHQPLEGHFTMAVQCKTPVMKKIDQWQHLYEPNFVSLIKSKFGESALPFSTIMEEV